MVNKIISRKDFDSIDNLEQYYSVLENLKPTVSIFGGRKFSYQGGISLSMNDIVRKFASLAKATLDKNQNTLTAYQKSYVNLTVNKLLCLDQKGHLLFRTASLLTKIFTVFFKFSNFFYNRRQQFNEIQKSCKLEEIQNDINQEGLSNLPRDSLLDILEKILAMREEITSLFEKYKEDIRLTYPLHTFGLNIANPREKAILAKFVLYQPETMTFEDLLQLGFDPKSDKDLFIQSCQECMKKGLSELAITGLKKLGIGIQDKIWKEIIDLCPPKSVPTAVALLRTIDADPLENRQLQTYIGLVQQCHEIQPLDFSHIDKALDLGTNTFQELKALTFIISALSVKGEEDKNVWKFLEAKRINGVTPAEQEYVQWLSGGTAVQWNGKNRSPLEMMPLDPLKIITRKLDLKSHVTLLSALKTPSSLMKAVWLSLLEANRSKIPKHGDVRDLVNLTSPHSILEHVRLYGPEIKGLDLTGIFYFDPNAKERREEQLKVLREVLKACSDLKTLRMASSGIIDEEIMALFPITLNNLFIEGCDVVSLNNIPEEVIVLRARTLELNASVIIPSLLGLYIETTSTNLSHLQGYENLYLLLIEILKSKNQFKELYSFLPAHLEIMKVGGISNEISNNVLTAGEFYDCMEKLSNKCLKLSDLYLPRVLVKFKKTTIDRLSQYKNIRALGCIWNEQLKELFRRIPENISCLLVSPRGHKFVDDDIDYLPTTLKILRLYKRHIRLSEAGKQALKDRGVALDLLD